MFERKVQTVKEKCSGGYNNANGMLAWKCNDKIFISKQMFSGEGFPIV